MWGKCYMIIDMMHATNTDTYAYIYRLIHTHTHTSLDYIYTGLWSTSSFFLWVPFIEVWKSLV